MAKIQEVKNKNYNGFEKCFNKGIVSEIMQAGHTTTIRCGNELEKIIIDKCRKKIVIKDLKHFISNINRFSNGVYICPKTAKNFKNYFDHHHPDFIVFIKKNSKITCFITELKDGFQFDTKKVPGEIANLKECCNLLRPALPKGIKISYRICCFAAPTKEDIVIGCKNRIKINNVITGEDFCKELGVRMQSIIKIREADAKYNQNYVIDKILNSNETKNYFAQHPEILVSLMKTPKIKKALVNLSV